MLYELLLINSNIIILSDKFEIEIICFNNIFKEHIQNFINNHHKYEHVLLYDVDSKALRPLAKLLKTNF